MKTNIILAVLIYVALSANGYAQVLTENLPIHSSIEIDSDIDTPETSRKSVKLSRRAVFNPTAQYSDLNQFLRFNVQFPDEARLVGESGVVKANYEILNNGSIGAIAIIDSPDPSFRGNWSGYCVCHPALNRP